MKKTALMIGGIVLSLLLVEVFLRVTDFGALRPQLRFDVRTNAWLDKGLFVFDKRLFWRQADGPHPPLETQYRIVHVDDPLPPKGRKFRVLCLGDSCTRLSGQGLPYSALLELELNPERVEVFNASLPGYSSHQGLAWLEMQLLAYAPDLVIVYFGWNDHWRSTGMTDREYAASLVSGRLRLLRLFQRRPQPAPLRVSTTDYAENLQRIAELVATRGGRTLLLAAPYHFTPENAARLRETGYTIPSDRPAVLHEQYLAVVRSLSGFLGARVFDAAEIFAQLDAPHLLLQRDGIHLQEVGHAILASLLGDAIAYDYLSAPGAAIDPLARGQVMLAQLMAGRGEWPESLRWYRQAIATVPDERGPRLGLAWLLATCPVDSLRDGAAALALVETLGADESDEPQALDVRAAALAEAGRFQEAADVMTRALARLEAQNQAPAEVISSLRERQDLYRSGRPYRVSSAPQP